MTKSAFPCRFGIEPLEQRIAPATIQLLNGISGNRSWTDPAIWDSGTVPTAADDVILDTAGATATISVSSAATARSITMSADEALNITNTLVLVGGAGAPGSIFTNVNLDGTLSLGSGASYSVTGALVFAGALIGAGTLDIAAGGALNIPAWSPDLATKVRVAGTVNQGWGHLDFVADNAEVEVLSGGVYSVNSAGYTWAEAAPTVPVGVVFQEGSVFRITGGTFYTNTVPLQMNGAMIDVADGSLILRGAPVLTNATINIAAGETFSFTEANATINGSLTQTGAGALRLVGGALTANAAGVTLNAPNFFWDGDATLTGGPVLLNGNLTLVSTSPNLATKLTTAGNIFQGNAHLDFVTDNAEIEVLAGGVYTVNSAGYSWQEAAPTMPVGVTFQAGSVFRITGGGFYTNTVPLQMNGATIDVVDGNFTFRGTPVLADVTINVASGETFSFAEANATINGSLTKTGTGNLRLDGGALTANAAGITVNTSNLFWDGDATLAGGPVLLNGDLTLVSTSPNLATRLAMAGNIFQGNAHLDFVTDNAELIIGSGHTYTTSTDGYRWQDGAPGTPVGVIFEPGSTFRNVRASFNTYNVPLQMNGATIDIVDGVLNLQSTPVLTNVTINVAAGEAFSFAEGNVAINGTLTKTGAGDLRFTGGILTANAAGITVNTSNLFWDGDATLAGGPALLNGDLTLVSTSPNLATRLAMAGNIFQGNAHLDFVTDNAELIIGNGHTYTTSTDGYRWTDAAPGTPVGVIFEPGSTFRNVRASFNTYNVPLQMNGATIDIVAGTLNLQGAPVLTDVTINVAAGKSFAFTSGNTTINGTLTKTGEGSLRLSGGTLTANPAGATINASTLFFEGDGTFAGGPFQLNSNLSIVSEDPNLATKVTMGGDVLHGWGHLEFTTDNAELVIPAGRTYTANNPGYSWQEKAPGVPVGVVVQAGGSLVIAGGSFNTNTVPLVNFGTVHAAGGSLSTRISGGALSGTWRVDAGQSINNSGPSLTANEGLVELRGSFNGFSPAVNTGTIRLLGGTDLTTGSTLTNSGSIELSAGSVLTVNSFTQTPAGAVTFHIAGTAVANLGRLQVSGLANLGGVANIVFDAPFSPSAGNGFTLAQFGSSTGAFADGEGFAFGRQKALEAVTDSTSYRINSLINAADLTTTVVTSPAAGVAGSSVDISYTVQNTGSFAIPATTWVDSIFLSRDGVLDSSDILVKRADHVGGLAVGETYTVNTSFNLPGVLPADYRVIVVADSRGLVPDANRASNALASASALTLDVPTLTEGVVYNGTISAEQDLYFRVDMPASKGRTFTLTTPQAGAAGLSVELGDVPGRFDGHGFAAGNSAVHQIVLPGGSAGEFYVHVHGSGYTAGTPFTLLADGLDFGIASSSVNRGSNADIAGATVTTTVKGTNFGAHTVFNLAGAASIAASNVVLRDSNTAFVTFSLQNQPLGIYSIVATDGEISSTLPNAFEVTNASAGVLDYSISAPSYIRAPYRGVEVTITYSNVGGTDLPAPYFTLFPTNTKLKLEGRTDFQEGPLSFLATSPDGPAGILAPGKTYTIRIPYVPTTNLVGTEVDFDLQVLGDNTDAVEWDVLKEGFRPDSMPVAAWDQVFANFKAGVGNSTEQFHRVLIENANYLSQFGPVGYDTTPLIGFELNQADDFGAISARYEFGMFGYGGAGPFGAKASADEFGIVTISDGPNARMFKLQPGTGGSSGNAAQYLPVGIDETGVLSAGAGGTLVLTEISGAVSVFRADGKLDYLQDPNGNRITGAYDAQARLTSLTSSTNGDVTSFTYNAAGFVAKVTDPVGRDTNYTYDTAGHVTSVSNALGTTTFAYSATLHAVTSKTMPDGVTTTYSYDAAGRMMEAASTGAGDDAFSLTYSYDSLGNVTITDGAGAETQVFRNGFGQIAKIVDPLGNTSFSTFDAHGRMVTAVDALGVVTASGYTGSELLGTLTQGDGGQIRFDYGAKNQLSLLTSPGNDIAVFAYDAKGNRISETHADGSFVHRTFDAQGRLDTATDARGIALTNTYNSAGLLARRDYSNGEFVVYTYDSHRNLLTATDGEGTTTFTYNSADLLTSVAYPNGKSVAFTYDAKNRRSSVTEGGFTVTYSYDSLGRLDRLTDTGGALIVDYDYNSRGLLSSETRGNGSSTHYSYDAAGRTSLISHRDAANAILEELEYSRDAIGRVTSVESLAGLTTYAYDLLGQLTTVTLPGGREISYTYDADGNRSLVTDGGALTTYSTTPGDRYSNVGGVIPQYDAGGRLIAFGSETYTYDAAGRLTGVNAGATSVTYDYDALGNRIGVITNGARADFAIDPSGYGNVLSETIGGVSTHYAVGLGVEGQFNAGIASYFHHDLTGNTLLLSGESSAVQNTYSYLPFGEISAQTGTTANRFTFAGAYGVQDDLGSNFYMRNREYQAGMGRFISRDPLSFASGEVNLYRYAGNNPVNAIDPLGLEMNEVSFGLQGEFSPGFGVNGGIGFAINTADLLDSGPYIQAGGSLGVGGGVTATVGVSESVDGWSTQAGAGAGFGGGAIGLTENGEVNAVAVNVSPVPSDFGATVSQAATVKFSPRNALEGTGLLGGAAYGFGYGAAEKLLDGLSALEREWGMPDGTLPDSARPGGSTDGLYNAAFEDAKQKGMDDAAAAAHARDAVKKSRPGGAGYYGPGQAGPGTPGGPGAGKGPGSRAGAGSGTVGPADPNQMIGPGGFGAEAIFGDIFTQPVRFGGYVADGGPFGYTILFENKPTAAAPAQVVTVTQTLDADLDMSTFEFVKFGWGDFEVFAPGGLTTWETRVDARDTLGLFVDIDAELNPLTRELTVIYTSIDPATNDIPLDPFAGFLPPNLTAPEGDGFLGYTVSPKTGLPSNTEFTAVASIIFDFEAPLATPTVTNKLDSAAPESAVLPFAAATSSRGKFLVNWTSSDAAGGSGTQETVVYYRDNGGPLIEFYRGNGTSAVFTGGEVGHTYSFFSAALDNVSNLEVLGVLPDATIQIAADVLPVVKKRIFTDSDGDTYTVSISGPGTLGAVLLDSDGDGKGALDRLILTDSTSKTKVTITVKRAKDGADADTLPDGDGIVTLGDLSVTGDLGSFSGKATDLIMEGIHVSGTLGKVTARDLAAAAPVLFVPGISAGGTLAAKAKLAVTARNLGDGFTIETGTGIKSIKAAEIGDGAITAPELGALTTTVGAMDADLAIGGAVKSIAAKSGANASTWSAASFGKIGASAGALEADVTATGAIGNITIKGGGLSGVLTASKFGKVSITDGSFTGAIHSETPAATLLKSLALAGLAVSGGDISGEIITRGAIGAIAAKTAKSGSGGSFTGAFVTASAIASIAAARDVQNSILLAGAALGADRAFGGAGADADTLTGGTIGKIAIGGNAVAAVIGAGLSSTNSILEDGDDSILQSATSKIASLIIKGSADGDSYFAAGLFGKASIAGASVSTATDPRFLVG